MRQIFLWILLTWLGSSIHLEIKDEQNGYKLVMEGEGRSDGKQLLINPLQILQNNLTPEQNISEILGFSEFGARLRLNDLEQIFPSKNDDMVQLKWLSRKRIQVLIKASKSDPIAQSNSALFNFIRKNTHVQLQDF